MKNLPLPYEHVSTPDFLHFLDSNDVEKFKKQLPDRPNLISDYAEEIVLYLFFKGRTKFFAALLEIGLDPNLTIGEKGQPLLVYLAENQSMAKRDEFIDILKGSVHLDVNSLDSERDTALRAAIVAEDDKLFNYLINRPDIRLNITSEKNPFVYAIKKKDLTI